MTLNTRQTATRLGVSTSMVSLLARQGRLRDIAAHAPGKRAHHLLFLAREVEAFARTYRRPQPASNGKAPTPPNAAPAAAQPAQGTAEILTFIDFRSELLRLQLERIADRLDTLIGLWK